MDANKLRAAQYVRMSTDMQRYSIENQIHAISLYAAKRGLQVVQTYEDAGRSGVTAGKRIGLQRLIKDVQTGEANFATVVVYDVSRWGRFQDSDESAYYEFLCRESGVSVEYCAEQFENDGSLAANVLKSIKRAMAGEFSRELSVKVFAGQSRIVSKGYFIGSTPGYGLRRCLVDESGAKKQQLMPGQRKSITTERTILVPGPAAEIAVIHKIYDMFIDERMSLRGIAKRLNTEGVVNVAGRKWTDVAVRDLLANEKYIGTSVYNRTSRKLNAPARRNDPSEWIKATGAYEPVVASARFFKAQKQLSENARPYSDNELLDHLSAMWCKHGRLNCTLIDKARKMPRVNAFRKHFGSLVNAYLRIGYPGRFNAGKNLNIRKQMLQIVQDGVHAYGGLVTEKGRNCQIIVNDEISVAVVVARPSASDNNSKWLLGYASKWKPDIIVVARLSGPEKGLIVKDFFVIPFMLLPNGHWLTASQMRYHHFECFRCLTLEPLFRLFARKGIEACYGR